MRFWLALLMLLTCPVWADVSLEQKDFAYGLPLIPEATAPVYELELPEIVYRSVVRSDLGDIRVFNASAEIVPCDLEQPIAEKSEPVTVTLPLFPLNKGVKGQTDLPSLRFSHDALKTIVELDLAKESIKDQSVKTYLLDSQSLERPIQGLVLNWDSTSDGFLYQVTVDASDDLRHWRPLIREASIADLAFAGHRLQRRHIDLTPVQTKYLRLILSGSREPLHLTEVRAELLGDTVEPPLRWTEVTVKRDKDKPDKYYFSMPGQMPVRRLRIKLPQDNTLVEVSVHSRPDSKAPWEFRGRGLFYRLTVGEGSLENNEMPVSWTPDRYWLLRVDQSGGGLGSRLPAVAIGWHPHTLLFVARGDAPFTLAYGSARAEATPTATHALLKRIDQDITQGLVSRAIDVGGPIVLGGEKVLEPPAKPIDWKQILLWIVLIGGVALLAWMAQRLLRETKNNL